MKCRLNIVALYIYSRYEKWIRLYFIRNLRKVSLMLFDFICMSRPIQYIHFAAILPNTQSGIHDYFHNVQKLLPKQQNWLLYYAIAIKFEWADEILWLIKPTEINFRSAKGQQSKAEINIQRVNLVSRAKFVNSTCRKIKFIRHDFLLYNLIQSLFIVYLDNN